MASSAPSSPPPPPPPPPLPPDPEIARRVARQILRGRHVDPTAGAVEWADIEEGPPPRGCLRVRIGGRWYFDPQTERRRK